MLVRVAEVDILQAKSNSYFENAVALALKRALKLSIFDTLGVGTHYVVLRRHDNSYLEKAKLPPIAQGEPTTPFDFELPEFERVKKFDWKFNYDPDSLVSSS